MITKEIYLTKEIILERVTEEEIVRFLVPSYDSNIRKKNYQSIFSEKDDRPSMYGAYIHMGYSSTLNTHTNRED